MTTPERRFSARWLVILGFLGLAILLGGFGYWSANSVISGAVIAPGRVEVEQQRQVVQHLDGGIVERIEVDEGDLVEAGQLLIRLDDTGLASNLEIVENQLNEYRVRLARLEAERDGADEITFAPDLIADAGVNDSLAKQIEGQRSLFRARNVSLERETDQLRRRQDQLGNQIEGVDAQLDALGQQLDLIQRELTVQQSLLDRGLAQSNRVLALQREEAQLKGRVGELTANRAQVEGRITEIDIEIDKLDVARRQEAISLLRDIEFRVTELTEQKRALDEQMGRLDITAPVSGIVYGLQVFAPRSVIRAADPVLYIVPQDRPLVIAAQVPPIDVDQVYPGQEVILRFSSFDQRQTPELFGTVKNISADAFEDQARGYSYFRAEITLNPEEVQKLPEGAALLPGMPVESFLRTADRTPLAYFVKPLADYFAKAFRES
ncbi:HlyD family type I secretion periplasmic adaptor subunit [Shimia biformata]|uniref:HlyD family type I secretion periplasmic adaptor subunit n=1 Tax=Shimia biformata TaxID=1294299 RepID=UPI0019521336|nr:HlyD family type I secretion periplasmic adaptor subunit [Shimia biformata]